MAERIETDNIDTKAELIQALIPLGLKAVEDELQRKVNRLAGPKGKHGKENTRWGRLAQYT